MPTGPAPQSLAELCETRAATHPHHPAVGDGVTELTYAALAARVRAIADRLRHQGVGPGDRVLICGHNCVTWVAAAFAVARIGATLVPVGQGASAGDRAHAVRAVAPRLLVAEDGLWPDAVDHKLSTVAFSDLATLLPDVLPERPSGPVDPDSDALVLATSGTTGAVRYVPMTHHQLIRLYADVAGRLGLTDSDRILGAVPLAHSFGFNGVLVAAFLAGAFVRLTPTYAPTSLAAVVREARLTVLAGPPTVFHDLAAAGAGSIGDSPRLAVTGSTEVSATTLRAQLRALGIGGLAVGYGMTEACGTVAVGMISEDDGSPLPFMTPLPGIELRICDDEGSELPPGSHGRILVRGYNLSRPYAAATDLAPGGWFDTGDVGTVDARGRLAVVGRRIDCVIVSGFNVYPAEVETVLLAHPTVAAAVVVGVADPRQGQRLVAGVVPRAAVDTDELIRHGRALLAAYKVPREYVVLDELPRTATGKVSRAALRQAVTRRLQ